MIIDLSEAEQQRDDLRSELVRAQAIIDRLKMYRELCLTSPATSTVQMRERIRELAYPPRDDFDRAVLAVTDDYERLLMHVNEGYDYTRDPINQPENIR